jgi:hypothetical protein
MNALPIRTRLYSKAKVLAEARNGRDKTLK